MAAVKAEKLIGYMIVYFAAGEGEIAKIAVSKEKQRQGVAHQMMKDLERICKSRKIGKLMLDVRQSKEAAQTFYKAQGFVRDGERKAFYEKPSEDAVLMSREIAYW